MDWNERKTGIVCLENIKSCNDIVSYTYMETASSSSPFGFAFQPNCETIEVRKTDKAIFLGQKKLLNFFFSSQSLLSLSLSQMPSSSRYRAVHAAKCTRGEFLFGKVSLSAPYGVTSSVKSGGFTLIKFSSQKQRILLRKFSNLLIIEIKSKVSLEEMINNDD